MFPILVFIFNIIGLSLEIIGFIIMIKSEKHVEIKEGGFSGPEFVYSDTLLPVKKTQVLGKQGLFRKGIVLVVCGLSMQLTAITINSFVDKIWNVDFV